MKKILHKSQLFYSNRLLIISFIAFLILSIDMLSWYNESMSRLKDWAYLAATTFKLFNDKWVFPNWVWAPWYHMISSYVFGPIFFLLYKLDYISLRTAGSLTFQYANVLLHSIGFFGLIQFCKISNFNKIQRNLFCSIFLLFPFINKHIYQACVETLVVSFFPWIFYYFLKIVENKKNKLKNLIKLSILFGLSTSSKVSTLFPMLIFFFVFMLNFNFKEFFKTKNFFSTLIFPLLSLLVFIFLSKLLIGNWIWENSDAGNSDRGYGGTPPFAVFTNFDLIKAFAADIRQGDLMNSMWNYWAVDFFADQSQNAFLKAQLNFPESYIIFKFRIGVVISMIFMIYYLTNLFYFFKNEIKNFDFINNKKIFRIIFVFSFFFIIPEVIAYTHVVYSKTGGNWDLRYWSIYAFPMLYVIIYNFGNIKNKNVFKLNQYFLYLILFLSFFQRINIFANYFS